QTVARPARAPRERRARGRNPALGTPPGSAPRPPIAGPTARAPTRRTSQRDRKARPAESILVPKVRIHFAEFPSPLSAVRPEAAHLGDLMRFSVRSRRPRVPPVRIFTGSPSRPKAARDAALFAEASAFCGRPDSCARSP
ncbi:uncharacterized protein, partial [Watersipora subatra]|uniref:uncharacterized protein n=1 Tax=Watersipora subatra TaxID=2589382 RepID=UPI00355BD1A0